MLGTRVFRVFVSSTFRDLKAKLDALQDCILPRLRAHCTARGYGFQVIDPRCGIRDEASLLRMMHICLSEARAVAVDGRGRG
jgi:hypothetical protein